MLDSESQGGPAPEDAMKACLEVALKNGASYADARFTTIRNLVHSYDAMGFSSEESNSSTLGVRVIVDGMWGFCGTSFTNGSVKDTVLRALKTAKAATKNSNKKVSLVATPTINARFETNFAKDPFKVPDSEVRDLLGSSLGSLREAGPAIKATSASIHILDERKTVHTSEGSRFFQRLVACGPLVQGSVLVGGRTYNRSYPRTLGPNFATKGFEHIESADLIANSERMGRELAQLQKARRCPQTKTDLIVEGDMLALLIHETIGHPTELDRATDGEWDFAGSTFLTTEKLGSISYGQPHINVVADATIAGGPGSYGFDDEAVSAKRVELIREGTFVGYQSSRESAAELGLPESSGAMRASAGVHLPLIRMSNINLLPGEWTREEMIAGTKSGILMTAPTMEIFDQRRRTFIFGAEIAWRIENGEIGEVLRDPIFEGHTIDFWHGCDSIAKDGWVPTGSGCGKGRPHQSIRVGHYCSQARFRDVRVGAPQ